ncbi:MAG: putative CoB--CoM heterodisulfide reductase 1 iron-sulfur subunit A [Promethearchaeota archaeon]|nr:MAG: putative CoB--CoM heterodisulfide reductase 1 iron-sulfur subunit A [Candidatus Lokiarchaeota archaeon]
MEKMGLDTTGQLNFHLKKLGSLVDKDSKSYYLTEDGKRVLKILNLNKRILAGEDIDEYFDTKGSDINRVGVIICNCNTEISNVVNINSLESYIGKIKNVVSVKIFANLCQQKNYSQISRWVKENFINKIVIAACSPKTHQPLFEKIFHDVIESSNIEIANIREQCAWVHPSNNTQIDPLLTLEKAKLLIEAAVKRVSLQKSIKVKRVEVEKSCAVIGGGIGGMTTALNLARSGIKVYLIEKSPTLGGKVARWDRIYNMGDCSICFISELIAELSREKNIEILTNTEVTDVSGEVGNFTIELIKQPRYVDAEKCTGCKQCLEVCSVEKPNQYEFGLSPRKLIYIPFIHSYPYAPTIDQEHINKCLECRICERACVNNAIDLTEKPEKMRIKVGAKVIAIGADLTDDLKEYNYNPQNDIITSAEFERILSSDGITEGKLLRLSDKTSPKSVSIIQDVGPSEYENEFSDIIALKYLNDIKLKDPECEVNVFCNLKRYRKDQQSMLKSIDRRFLYANEIEIEPRGDGNVIIADSVEFPSDLIVLNVNLVPNEDLKKLRKIMDFTLNDYGFMSEETLASGIYGVGSIFGPLSYQSTIDTANSVALKVISVLSQDYLMAEFSGIEVDEDKCGLCGLCVSSCPYNALILENTKISIDKFKCKGCGVCVSVCPTDAIEMNIDSSEKINTTLETLSKFDNGPKIVAFCCNSCGYAAADDAGLKRIPYKPNVFIIKVPCTGRVDASFIIKAFELGFDGVMVVGCRKDACRYIDGIQKVEKKIDLLEINLGKKYSDRVILKHMNAVEGNKFAASINEFYKKLDEAVLIE